MLPTTSAGDGGKPTTKGRCARALFRSQRRVAVLLLGVGIAGFLWMQYTMLSSSFFTRPQLVRANQLRRPTRAPAPAKTGPVEIMKETPPLTLAPGELPVTQQERTRAIKAAMQFAWSNYERGAFGADEVDPVSGARKEDVWGGIACSLVDALDTLWIMDMKAEFARAREYVATKLSFSHLGANGNKISIFETIIREVGGLLSAFDLSGDDVFKRKAQELMDLLVPAFVPSEGVFYTYFNPKSKSKGFASWTRYNALIADIGSLQLETRYLSDVTGDPKYAALGEAFYEILQREGPYQDTGLFPVHFDTTLGKFVNESVFSIGAYGDSFYEYLLKVFIYSGKRDEDVFLRDLYDDAVRGIDELLLQFDSKSRLYFIQQLRLPHMSGVHDMDHLLCFLPGLLALGTLHEHHDVEKNERHLALAKKVMNTCYQMYHTQATGLAPDVVEFPYMLAKDVKYKLRPETIESLFYMYRVTNDTKYREYGWEIFQSLEKHAKVAHGYGAVLNVREVPAKVENKMESFFLAETLKYHYLLQASEQLIPLDEYVFNTEAHPLRIRQRSKTK